MPQKPLPPKKVIHPEIVLAKEVSDLTKLVKRMTSLRMRFLFGIIEGFGGVIGATIVVSIALFVLTQLEQVGFLKPFVESILNLAGK